MLVNKSSMNSPDLSTNSGAVQVKINDKYNTGIHRFDLTPPLPTPLAPDNCKQIHMWRVHGFSLGSTPEGR